MASVARGNGLLAKLGGVVGAKGRPACGRAQSSPPSSIYRGLVTGLNKAFIIDNQTKEALIREDPRSAEILKPVVRGRDVHPYRVDWDGLWLIATFPAAGVNIDDYPAVRRWLSSFGKRLHQTGEKLPGGLRARKKTQHDWWELQDSCAYYAEFEKPKILWPEISDEAAFALCREQMFCNNKVYFLTVPSGDDLLSLFTVLSSDVIRWYGRQITVTTGGGSHSWFKYSVEAFPIPQRGIEWSGAGLRRTGATGPPNRVPRPARAFAQRNAAVAELYGLTSQDQTLLDSLNASV